MTTFVRGFREHDPDGSHLTLWVHPADTIGHVKRRAVHLYLEPHNHSTLTAETKAIFATMG